MSYGNSYNFGDNVYGDGASLGSIGAFYFGTVNQPISASPSTMVFSAQTPNIVAVQRQDQNIHPQQSIIIFRAQTPNVITTKDIDISFIGIPRAGVSPLTVDFSAIVNFNGNTNSLYMVNKYRWFFDYDNNPTIYEEYDIPTVTHVYSGYYGQKFSVVLQIDLKGK